MSKLYVSILGRSKCTRSVSSGFCKEVDEFVFCFKVWNSCFRLVRSFSLLQVFGLWKGSNVAVVLDCSDANLGFGRQGSFSDILLVSGTWVKFHLQMPVYAWLVLWRCSMYWTNSLATNPAFTLRHLAAKCGRCGQRRWTLTAEREYNTQYCSCSYSLNTTVQCVTRFSLLL